MTPRKSLKIEPLVVKAIRRLQDVKGSTAREINEYINRQYDVSGPEVKKHIQIALKRAVAYGILTNKGGHYVYNTDLLGMESMDNDEIMDRRKKKSRRRSNRKKGMSRRKKSRRTSRRKGRKTKRGMKSKKRRGRSQRRTRKYDDFTQLKNLAIKRPLRKVSISRARNGSQSGDSSRSESIDGRHMDGSRHGSQHICPPESHID